MKHLILTSSVVLLLIAISTFFAGAQSGPWQLNFYLNSQYTAQSAFRKTNIGNNNTLVSGTTFQTGIFSFGAQKLMSDKTAIEFELMPVQLKRNLSKITTSTLGAESVTVGSINTKINSYCRVQWISFFNSANHRFRPYLGYGFLVGFNSETDLPFNSQTFPVLSSTLKVALNLAPGCSWKVNDLLALRMDFPVNPASIGIESMRIKNPVFTPEQEIQRTIVVQIPSPDLMLRFGCSIRI
ncbi:MAG: hypothetical protein GC181_10395 [Bacteroidetes bacterium]|nr:hypothetical protein [Bacteroidota bacterium]